MELNDFTRQLASLAALDEPVRRRLYRYVVARDGDVSRDQAARALRISRALAAFHLDKLVKAGLLEATFRRLSARTGPGAGRPAKLYRRATTAFGVSLPPRRYELAAHIFAQALARLGDEHGTDSVRDAARDWGARLAPTAGTGTESGRPLERATRALNVCGYEARTTPEGEVVLCNCPFDSLRAEQRPIACGMNLALVEGLLTALDLPGLEARLDPRPPRCCVVVRERAADA